MSSRDESFETPQDDSYVSRSGDKEAAIPVQRDGADFEDPIDAETADSDEQLGASLLLLLPDL